MHIFESGEDYLERILMLQNELGNVRAIDIANSMNYSKPSVSVALKKLKANNLIEINNEGNITLTVEGRKKALEVYERHTIITKFLLHIGVNKDVALKDACKIEHDLSDETFNKLKEFCNTIK
jgi:Mn-dependent DtxR family transcriptional regulator